MISAPLRRRVISPEVARCAGNIRLYSSLRTNIPPPGQRRIRRRREPRYQGSQLDSEPKYEPPQYEMPFGEYQYPAQSQYPVYGSSYPTPEYGIIQPSDAVVHLLSQPALVIERQLELMNVVMGFEQANRYAIMDTYGNHIGYMEEEDIGITKMLLRQVYRLHRPFVVRVYDRYNNHILTIRRPFSLINSHIKAILPGGDGTNDQRYVVGETKQEWHPWRRRYNLFLRTGEDEYDQYGRIDAPFLSFSFLVRNEQGQTIAAVDRNWRGLMREFITDTGIYVLRMDRSAFSGLPYEEQVVDQPLTLDQRAIMLGAAVSIDFDYFSRHSNRGGVVDVE